LPNNQCTCYILSYAVYNIYFNPLRAYPGPKLCAVTRIPWLLALIRGRQTHHVQNLHEIYGEVVRIAPNELSYINPRAWKDIYAHRQGKEEMPKERRFYSEQPGSDNIIIANRQNHSRFRKTLSHSFSDLSIREQEPLIKKYIDLLIRRLGEISHNGQTSLNMVEWYNFTTFDLIGDLTFGEPFDCLKKADYHPWVSLIFDSVKVGSYVQALRYVPGGQRLVSLLVSKELLAKKADHHALTTEKVKNRISQTEERPDFMNKILKREKDGMAFPELLGNSAILIIAGSETTATVLSGVTFLLLKNPTVMAKVVHEVRSTFANEDEINIAAMGNLRYMLACLDETMRIYPAVPVGLPRIVPGNGDFINGKWVPGGVSPTLN
jgi:cytochrome P450